jgi:hypothetical protein
MKLLSSGRLMEHTLQAWHHKTANLKTDGHELAGSLDAIANITKKTENKLSDSLTRVSITNLQDSRSHRRLLHLAVHVSLHFSGRNTFHCDKRAAPLKA